LNPMKLEKYFLGIHSGHDANVSVSDQDGRIVFASGEERFNRIKMFAGFPGNALNYALSRYGRDVTAIAAPRMKLSGKILRELSFFTNSFLKKLAAPRFGIWVKQGFRKMVLGREVERSLPETGINPRWPVINVEHHHAHAAGAFYSSGFSDCYVMTLDGEGDGFSCCFYLASSAGLRRIKAFYHNEVTVGRDYEKVTAMLGFHPLRHPGKITGLAAYGTDNSRCIDALENYLWTSWKTNRYKLFAPNPTLEVISEEGCNKLRTDRQELFAEFTREDMAFAIQYLTERKVLDMIRTWFPDYKDKNIALAGGVFANVALNKKIQDLGFKNIFVMPAMSDSGLSLGALLHANPRDYSSAGLDTVYLGPEYTADEIRHVLEANNIEFESPKNMAVQIANEIAEGKVIARFDGRMEYGPRALGNRSILYHAGDPKVNDWLNRQLKRTEFMPFAPVTLQQFAPQCYKGYYGAERTARFMTITFDCTEKMRTECPAVVHVDGTARPQVINETDNPGYAAILDEYLKLTGIPSLINTSFNMHEEPIVMTPGEAVRAFTTSELDILAIGPYIVRKK